MGVCTFTLCTHSAGWGRKISWTLEFETSLGNMCACMCSHMHIHLHFFLVCVGHSLLVYKFPKGVSKNDLGRVWRQVLERSSWSTIQTFIECLTCAKPMVWDRSDITLAFQMLHLIEIASGQMCCFLKISPFYPVAKVDFTFLYMVGKEAEGVCIANVELDCSLTVWLAAFVGGYFLLADHMASA